MKIVSHTIVKNGMPFIGEVLKAALPIVDRMIINLSIKSNDGTREVINGLQSSKIELYEENVLNLGELTIERQKQVNMTDFGDIIWFLDDDDFWLQKEALNCIDYLKNNDLDAISINPYQILDSQHEDARWVNKKYFTKFFKNININYKHPWPRDLIYKDGILLYHKSNPRNHIVPFKFFHLAAVKNFSFRRKELMGFNDLNGVPKKLEVDLPQEIKSLLVDK